MPTLISISRSTNKGKKFKAVFEQDSGRSKTVHFGQSQAEHYTEGHLDEQRKENYQNRHRNDRLNDPMSAGALSWYLLWHSKTYSGGLAEYKKNLNITVKSGALQI